MIYFDSDAELIHEVLELLNIPGFLDECKEGLSEIRMGGGKTLSELEL